MSFSKYISFLRLMSLKEDLEDGISKKRLRLALLTAITSLFNKAVIMLVMIFSVRLSLPYLGVERFGIWMTIASLVGLLNFLDLGVGNALTNRVAKIASPSYKRYLPRSIGAGILILLFISFFIGIILYLVAEYIPWQKFLKITNKNLYNETHAAIKVFAILFALSIFTGGINRIFFGLQKGYEANLSGIVGSLLSFLFIWTAIKFDAGIPTMLAANMCGGMIANFLLLLLLALRKQISLRRFRQGLLIEAPYLLRMGGGFFLLQIGTIAVIGADNLIIASSLGVAAVATYSVTQKLFQFVTQPCAVMNSGLWPAYANANAHGDKLFILRTLKTSMAVTIWGATILSLLLIFFGKTIISWWTHQQIDVNFLLMASIAFWSVAEASANAFAMFMNGTSLIKHQIGGVSTLVFFGIPLKIYLINSFGIEVMLIGFSLFFLANIFFWYGIMYRKTILNTLL
jgi:O-antigen/teichoic acid export membrane protein